MVPWKSVYNLFPIVLSSQNSVFCEDARLQDCCLNFKHSHDSLWKAVSIFLNYLKQELSTAAHRQNPDHWSLYAAPQLIMKKSFQHLIHHRAKLIDKFKSNQWRSISEQNQIFKMFLAVVQLPLYLRHWPEQFKRTYITVNKKKNIYILLLFCYLFIKTAFIWSKIK